MPLSPETSGPLDWVEQVVSSAWSGVMGLFEKRGDLGFSPERVLSLAPGIDPHFIPRAPMSNANLDVGLLAKLSKFGMKRCQEITAHSHPALHKVFVEECRRAGLGRVPQLIVGESRRPNAASLFDENAVVISTSMLSRFNFREVCDVLGHEIGHEASNHTGPRVLANMIFSGGGVVIGNDLAHRGGVGSLIPFTRMREGAFKKTAQFLFGTDHKPLSLLGSVWYVIAGGWLGSIPARQISVRPTELEADRKGAMISGDPEGLAMALEKLESGRMYRGIWPEIKYYFHKLTSGYPATETRIAKLRQMALAMPPETVPAYLVATAGEAPSGPVAMPVAASPSVAPVAQVTAVEQAARVTAPHQATAAAV